MMHSSLRRPGVATLATMALSQMTDLLEAEFRLARAELSEKMSALRAGLIIILLGAVFLIVALGMVLQALVAVLLVAGGAAVLGLMLFLIGQRRLKPAELTPDRTLKSLSRDSRLVKET